MHVLLTEVINEINKPVDTKKDAKSIFLFHYRGGPACSWSCQWLGQRWASCPDSGSPSSAARPPSIVCGRRHAAQRRQVI